MTGEQIKQLAKMKKLINQGYRRFASRKDRDYLNELSQIGITEDKAWNEILTLSANNYVYDYKPFYDKRGNDALIFKKIIKTHNVYIKLKIEKNDNQEETVCLSFHIDYR